MPPVGHTFSCDWSMSDPAAPGDRDRLLNRLRSLITPCPVHDGNCMSVGSATKL
jgi:hypothetical protein